MNSPAKNQSPRFSAWGKSSDDSPQPLATYLLVTGREPEENVYVEYLIGHDGEGWYRWVVRLALDGDRIVVRELSLVPPDSDNEVPTTTIFARARLGELHRELVTELQSGQMQWIFLPEHWRGKSLTLPKPGRRGHPESFYAMWVKRYVDALEREPRSPVKLLAEEHHYSRGQIRAWLDKAEHLGLLVGRPSGMTGRAGGRMSAKCRRVLEGKRTGDSK